MIKVKLVAYTNKDPLDLASHAARVCYQSTEPEWGKRIDVQNTVFKTGHHTTMQHFYFTFMIDGIAVGDITFGLHLASPFYNSCQRSGRYCAKMFIDFDKDTIVNYIKTYYWPNIPKNKEDRIIDYLNYCHGFYQDNLQKATEVAAEFLKKERPYASQNSIEKNAPKIAQEQMRMFIPLVFPTGLDFTINLTALAAMYQSAWTPVMKDVTQKMADLVVKRFPELKFVFDVAQREDEWAPKILSKNPQVKYKPELKLFSIYGEKDFVVPDSKIMHPIDQLHFRPEMMENSVGGVITKITLSSATMGQDQRHRTIKRGVPSFTGDFYLPPILRELKLKNKARYIMGQWLKITKIIPTQTLVPVLAPYGAMVTYTKNGSFNAIAHEQAKRLCWLAQEEIYHLGRLWRIAIEKKGGKKSLLLKMFEPHCYNSGVCGEGNRYCGREIKKRLTGEYFPERKV